MVLETPLDGGPPSNDQKNSTLGLIRQPVAGAKPTGVEPVTWSYEGPLGTRSRGVLLDVRRGWALVGQYGIPSSDDPRLGYDEISLVDLTGTRFGLLNLGGLGKRDIHVAGLVE